MIAEVFRDLIHFECVFKGNGFSIAFYFSIHSLSIEVCKLKRLKSISFACSEGFAATSLIPQAKNLKGKLLICQGAIDDVVVWQHSLSFIDACIDANVPVDYFPYPRSKHNVRGKWRVHLMQKVTDYFEDYLR